MKKLILLVFFFGFYKSVFSQWSTDPNVNNQVSTISGNQQNVAACPDGAGGIIICWVDVPTAKIYAQKINTFGQAQWPAGGINISGNTGDHSMPCICSDAAGGAIIGWRDTRNGTWSVYAQRVRTDGNLLWTSGGVKVSFTNYSNLIQLKCMGAEAGYAIFAWVNWSTGLYSQKLDAFGVKLWNATDLQISFIVTDSFDMCRDAQNGGYFTYSMFHTNPAGYQEDIFAQHVSALGDTLWNIHKEICHDTLPQIRPSMCEDQDFGFVVAWEDPRAGNADIYAARLDSAGNQYWGTNGKQISSDVNNQRRPYCISDAHGGAHIVWLDGDGLWGQNVTHNGATRWATNGIRIAHRVDGFNTQDGRNNPQVASVDALGGLIACWIGYYDDALTQYGVLAQRLDYSGNLQWNANGVFVTKGSLKKGPALIFDGGSSGCNIAWADGRNFALSGYDIYAQHIKSGSELGNRPALINNNISKLSTIKQNFPNPFNPLTNISFDISSQGFVSLKVYDMTGREVAVLANGVYAPGEYSVTWDATDFATGAYLYKFITNEKTEIKTMMLIK